MIHGVIHLKFVFNEPFNLESTFEADGGGDTGGGDVFLEGVAEAAMTGDDFMNGG